MEEEKDLALKTASADRVKDGIGIVKGSRNEANQRKRHKKKRDVSS